IIPIGIWKGYFSKMNNLNFSKIESSFINVSCCAIAYGMYLGYKEIGLLGCDFTAYGKKNLDNSIIEKTEYISSLKNDLYGYALAVDTHEKISKYAQKNNIKIININDRSLLDTYLIDKEEYFRLKR
ncbi:hypothetical protein, partial [Fusobacterium mortiferum]